MNDELSRDAKDLLELATKDDSLSPAIEDRHRVRKRIGVAVAAGGAVGLGATAAKASAAAGSAGAGAGVAGIAMGGLGLKSLAALAIVGGVVGVGALSIPSAPTEPSVPASAVAPSVSPAETRSTLTPATEAEPSVESEGAPVEEPMPPLVAAPIAPAARNTNAMVPSGAPIESPISDPPVAADDEPAEAVEVSLGDELAYLQAAQRARVAGDTTEALRQLAAHEARFPDGRLAAERDGTRVFVLCDARRHGEASAARAEFLSQYAHSPLARRVEVECR